MDCVAIHGEFKNGSGEKWERKKFLGLLRLVAVLQRNNAVEHGKRVRGILILAEIAHAQELEVVADLRLGEPRLGKAANGLEGIRIQAGGEILRRGGGFLVGLLFGRDFGLADVMYAPVATRFLTWQPDLSATSRAYVDAVRAHPLMERWYADAAAEPAAWLIEKYEDPA